ncbi:hypothetical protein D3C81_1522250 [compost metagenome]
MQGADALEHLAHHRRLGRIGEALADMPLRQCGKTQAQRVLRQLAGVIHQIAHDGIAGGRQEAAPAHFEMLDGRAIAAPGVLPRTGPQVPLDFFAHLPFLFSYRWTRANRAFTS